MKYFRMTYDEVVFKRSYLNIMLLNRSIPTWEVKKDDEEEETHKNASKKAKTHEYQPLKDDVSADAFFMGMM